MAEKITMPKLGFDMAEGTLVRWVIQEGEDVEKGLSWPRSKPIKRQ
jgi:pyruvate dehydrogenase E2 component (dihydrolipoamide acetyltransferase)